MSRISERDIGLIMDEAVTSLQSGDETAAPRLYAALLVMENALRREREDRVALINTWLACKRQGGPWTEFERILVYLMADESQPG